MLKFMNSKKIIVLLFAILLSISLPAVSATKPKVGAPCPSIGKSQIIGSLKYICSKTGKKLLWKVTTVKLKPAPTPLASSSPSPVATPTPSPTQTSTATPSPTPTPSEPAKKTPKTQEDFRYRELLFKAWQEQLDLKKPANTPNIKYFIDPNFPKISLASIQSGMQNVLDTYGYLLKPNTKVNVFFSSSYDFEISAIKSDPEIYQDYLNEDPNWSRHTWRISQYQQPLTIAGGTYPMNGRAAYLIYFRLSPSVNGEIWRYLGAHETFHLMQWMINDNFPQVLPAWWIEGQAQQVAEVIGNAKKTTESIDDEMLRLKGDYGPGFNPSSSFGLSFSKMEGDAATRTEFGCEMCSTNLIYTRGKLAIDYLIATQGHDRVIDFMKSLNVNNRWWQSFEKNFGISVEKFYKELEGLVIWYGNYYAIE